MLADMAKTIEAFFVVVIFGFTTQIGAFEAKSRCTNIFLKLLVIREVNTKFRHFTQFPETRNQLTEIDGGKQNAPQRIPYRKN
jgi:hypothetical protein